MADATRNLIDTDLGGVIKLRIARPGEGKSGCFRAIVLFRTAPQAFFVQGFAKNEQDTIRNDELAAFRLLATVLLDYDDKALSIAIDNGTLTEVMCNAEGIP